MSGFREQLGHAWTEHHGRPPNWVEEILIDAYAEHMDAARGRIIGDTKNARPLGFLGAAEPVLETEEERVTRELVPLVRAAADKVPLPRAHSRTLPCWCDAVDWAGVIVHNDERVDRQCVAEMPQGWLYP